MPKFNCSYAYDISCYFDFAVEAKNEKEAQKKIEKALTNGVFMDASAEPNPENYAGNDRVFTSGRVKPKFDSNDWILKGGKLVEVTK